MMGTDKINSIIETMQGITYLEWQKLKHVIDVRFASEAAKRSNEITMESPADIMDSYRQLF